MFTCLWSPSFTYFILFMNIMYNSLCLSLHQNKTCAHYVKVDMYKRYHMKPIVRTISMWLKVIWSTNQFMWESMGRNSRWKSIGKCAKCKWFTKYGGTWGWWRHSFWNRQVGGSHVNFHFKPCNDHVLHCLSHKGVGEGVGSDFFVHCFYWKLQILTSNL